MANRDPLYDPPFPSGAGQRDYGNDGPGNKIEEMQKVSPLFPFVTLLYCIAAESQNQQNRKQVGQRNTKGPEVKLQYPHAA